MTIERIDAALAKGDMHGAARVAEAMLSAGQRDPMLLNIAAWAREEAGDFDAALALLGEALALAPDDPLLHLSLGAVMRKQGRLAEAFATFAKVAPLVADNPAYWLERGYTYEAANMIEAAAVDFAAAVALDPASAPPWASLASMQARLGSTAEARASAARALALDPPNPTAIITLARCDLDAGDAASAHARLEPLTQRDDVHIAERVLALGLLGDANDRLDATGSAFAAYQAANASFRRQHPGWFAPDSMLIPQSEFFGEIGAEVASIDPALWRRGRPPASPARGHVFLLGYPRSGTTLVENILASAAGVEALEERPTLDSAERAFLSGGDGLMRLAALGDDGLVHHADAYWAQVRRFGVDPVGKCVVDMDPLKGMKLPLIAKLFPDARVVVMRRDPRDVVWSCFRTNFVPTAAAAEFTTLEGAARHYDALMRLMEQCFATLPLSAHQLRYDAVVRDFDATTQALCDFLKLDWTPKMRAFDKTAQRRGVGTASAAQVRRGLYDGTRQWERYKAQMEPVLPILQPWVERFGFGEA